ncbi:MAG: SH3 domain-containing protein [Methyloceanibacter sp.]
MRTLLPSVWLVAAALYTASILALTEPFASEEAWPAPPVARETVVAKLPPAVTVQALMDWPAALVLAALPPAPKARRDEWMQIGAYTTVVRAHPSAAAPPLYAYPAGRPFRVLAREGAFARVQDLGSGKLGWIEQTSLVRFIGGYRQPDPLAAAPLVAAVTPQSDAAEAQVAASAAAAPGPIVPAPAAMKKTPPRHDAVAVRRANESLAAAEAAERGLFRKRRAVQRVALGGRDRGFAGMIDRAFRGF